MKESIRVLHVIGRLDRGGIETWLADLTDALASTSIQSDFFATLPGAGALDARVQKAGGEVFSCARRLSGLRLVCELYRTLRAKGPYDVVHSHVSLAGGLTTLAAAIAGVPARFVHAHNQTTAVRGSSPARRAYELLTRYLLRIFATRWLAISQDAGSALFGGRFVRDPRSMIISCGRDFSALRFLPPRLEAKTSLGLPAHSLVVGHIGRFVPVKNHDFLLKVFEQIAVRRPEAYLLMVGAGPLRASLQERVESWGLSGRCIFLGEQERVGPALAAMDVFLFPSESEGLGLAAIEAQAAGIPVIVSTAVPHECVVVESLCRRLSIEIGPTAWADHTLETVRQTSPPVDSCWQTVASSEIAIGVNSLRVRDLYRMDAGPR